MAEGMSEEIRCTECQRKERDNKECFRVVFIISTMFVMTNLVFISLYFLYFGDFSLEHRRYPERQYPSYVLMEGTLGLLLLLDFFAGMASLIMALYFISLALYKLVAKKYKSGPIFVSTSKDD